LTRPLHAPSALTLIMIVPIEPVTVDPTDASLLDAALRECEEIALPRAAVEPLGALDDTETVATRFVNTPFVGLVRETPAERKGR
jgi:hypothetical protein